MIQLKLMESNKSVNQDEKSLKMIDKVFTTQFQSFDSSAKQQNSEKRLAHLRDAMKNHDLDVWLLPHADEHQNEYPPAHAWRLAWLTGFSGSAGYCIVTQTQAIVFVDGRYTVQLEEEIDTTVFSPGDLINNPPDKWLSNWLSENVESDTLNIGFDPWLLPLKSKNRFAEIAAKHQAKLVARDNLIDQIWDDQPSPPLEPITIHPIEYAGKLALTKIDELKAEISKTNNDYCLLTDPASIAWLLNIRGLDTPHTPLPLTYAIIRAEGYPLVFVDKRKTSRETEAYLTQLADLHPPARLDDEIKNLLTNTPSINKFMIDPAKVSTALCDTITKSGGLLVHNPDPVVLPRAIKNSDEITGSRNAHLRDGVAVTRFLFWLDQQPPASIDEITAVKALETFRREVANRFEMPLKDISFDTISGAGTNGAIVHYRVNQKSNAVLTNNSVYLVDSGGQYEDGTTDITRTIAIGTPPPLAIEDFTLVLKGHIAIATIKFPQATRGIDIDAFARSALWQHGRDYAHGTGHGIGSYLSVHEGPQSISRRGMAELQPGMILSNEPGFYRTSQYGIRIENLVLVNPPQTLKNGNVPVMSFETLSLAPIDQRLIDPALLNGEELDWLNTYHNWVYDELSPHMNEAEKSWLKQGTAPVQGID